MSKFLKINSFNKNNEQIKLYKIAHYFVVFYYLYLKNSNFNLISQLKNIKDLDNIMLMLIHITYIHKIREIRT